MSVNSGDRPLGEGGSGGGEGALGAGKGRRSWAQLLGSSLPSSMNKNILEVVLEKDDRGAFVVSDDDCARLIRKLGLDQRPGVQVEGVQICPSGRGVILITLKDTVKVENYCRYDILEVTESGIRSTMVKPAGKKEVVITVKGIHPNTRDSMVLNYLSKFGKVVTTKVVHGVFNTGPLKGMKNGDRSYKLEIKPGVNIGSYHVLEGQKVSLRYQGQQQTCGRCHETPQLCKGRGIAKKCQAEGGVRIEFSEYILGLWNKIGYTPQNEELGQDLNAENEAEEDNNVEAFTPPKAPNPFEVFVGVSIKQFPKETDQGEIMELLCKCRLPVNKTDAVLIKPNGIVTIRNLDDDTCKALIASIHGKQNFGRRLFCNGIIPLTPKKDSPAATQHPDQPAVPSPGTTTANQSCPPAGPQILATENFSSAHSFFNNMEDPGTDNLDINSHFVRRYSASLLSRTPPEKSIAAEILGTPRPDMSRTKSLVNDIKDYVSDFGSGVSDLSDAGEDNSSEEIEQKNDDEDGYQTMNDKKRKKKNKRKFKLTPGKEEFLKKPNLVLSPQYRISHKLD